MEEGTWHSDWLNVVQVVSNGHDERKKEQTIYIRTNRRLKHISTSWYMVDKHLSINKPALLHGTVKDATGSKLGLDSNGLAPAPTFRAHILQGQHISTSVAHRYGYIASFSALALASPSIPNDSFGL